MFTYDKVDNEKIAPLMICVDTSVLVAYYCPEAISPKAEKAIIEDDSPVVSPLSEVEFASAVAKKVRERLISKKSANIILNEFQSHIHQLLFKRIPIEVDHFSLAFNWLVRLEVPLSMLDALHLAAAFKNNLEIVTADRQLSRAASKLSIQYRVL
jgi:predicted nucleic acid-binding protein